MANVFTPNGFQVTGRADGAAWSAAQRMRQILYSNTHQIFKGMPVQLLSTGYVDTLAPGTTAPLGIFEGCSYVSISQKRLVWSPYFPGADVVSGSQVFAYIDEDPFATLVAQSGNGGPVTQASVGMNVNFAVGTGNTLSGLSGAYVDFATIATTATLPFRILELVTSPPGANGTDATTAYNLVKLAWNFNFNNQTTGV